jgi:hypothetical protein
MFNKFKHWLYWINWFVRSKSSGKNYHCSSSINF